jgi:hypothetical protein
MTIHPIPEPFAIKDSALSAIATGVRVQNLKELRTELETIHTACIYYHFWGSRLRPSYDSPIYTNDFALWARHGLHDHVLSERLSVIDPTDFADLEELRQELIEVLEERMEESEHVPWSRSDRQFHFVRSQLVVFDTHRSIAHPRDLCHAVRTMSIGSIYYHFISARRRVPIGLDDFRVWLGGFGDSTADACAAIARIDPFFLSLTELRTMLSDLLSSCQWDGITGSDTGIPSTEHRSTAS